MVLLGLVAEMFAVVATMLVVACLVFVGPRAVTSAIRDPWWRMRAVAVPFSILVAVLSVRWLSAELLPRISWRVIGVNITPYLWTIERDFVATVQSLGAETTTSFAVFMYLYGYAFLIVFPFLAYFTLSDSRYLETLTVAYVLNYMIGLLMYVVFIAYGPRNTNPAVFDDTLYSFFPHAAYLTHEVNQNINVFPSLHTSLSVTVLLLAWLSRDKYPLWVAVAAMFAVGVSFSTMYLGIHWFTDVVAGTILASVSVYTARRLLEGDVLSISKLVDGRFNTFPGARE